MDNKIVSCHVNNPEVYGMSEKHLVSWVHQCVHNDIVDDLKALTEAASDNGFELGIASAFRSYERQLAIWNAKASGARPVLDDFEAPIDTSKLTAEEIVYKILRWSALPGASRHHWGTDFDVFDAGAVKKYHHKLQLTVAETEPGGPFAEFYMWLAEYLSDSSCMFFRPYLCDRGGVACEPWHLSHINVAMKIQQDFNLSDLRIILQSSPIQLQDAVLNNLDAIYSRFIEVTL